MLHLYFSLQSCPVRLVAAWVSFPPATSWAWAARFKLTCQCQLSTQWQEYFYAPCAWDVIRWSLSETNAPCAWDGPRFDALPHLPRVVLGQSPPRCRYIYVTFGFYHIALCVTEWKFCEHLMQIQDESTLWDTWWVKRDIQSSLLGLLLHPLPKAQS